MLKPGFLFVSIVRSPCLHRLVVTVFFFLNQASLVCARSGQ